MAKNPQPNKNDCSETLAASSAKEQGQAHGLVIQYREVSELIPYARNSRTHTEDQIKQVAASIQEFGFNNPVLLRYNSQAKIQSIVAGHARCEAARLLGLKEVPTINLDHLTEYQARAYIIADNRLAEQAGWDLAMLNVELGDLELAGFAIDLTGFDEKDRKKIVNELEREAESNRREDEDDESPLPAETTIQPGQVIELGAHRLICGDSTDPEIVEKLLGEEKPGLMVTDPPYGVEYDASWRSKNGLQREETAALGKVANDDRADWREAWALFPGKVAYVWHGGMKAAVVAESLIASDFNIRSQIIWVKNGIVIGRGDYHFKHEPCWYAVRKGKTGNWTGSRKESTVWEIDRPLKSETGHSTQKPVECMRRPIINNSSPGQLIYDPFGGSGTTLVAAELTGRIARIVEITPVYCQMIVDRYNKLFGNNANGA